MNEVKELVVLFKDGSQRKCLVKVAMSEPWVVSFSQSDLGETRYESDDLFKSLLLLRAALEEKGHKLLCNGSRKNVVVSGMSRQMSGGRKAYLVKIGKQARRDNLVDIFDCVDSSFVGTVEQQIEFYREWLRSLCNE
ncbi:hypothetical protein [Pseudomonas jessenii]|uniref:hypothetical protein n=1 Tax=Pseudomonas jessenii TaxID=77298 RepID=UPI0032E3D096